MFVCPLYFLKLGVGMSSSMRFGFFGRTFSWALVCSSFLHEEVHIVWLSLLSFCYKQSVTFRVETH